MSIEEIANILATTTRLGRRLIACTRDGGLLRVSASHCELMNIQ
jgi:hypothetical protein